MKGSGHQTSIGQKQADKMTQLQTRLRFQEKGRWGGRGQGRGVNLMGVWLVGFQNCLGLVTLSFFYSLPFLFLYLLGGVESSLWQAGYFISAHRL